MRGGGMFSHEGDINITVFIPGLRLYRLENVRAREVNGNIYYLNVIFLYDNKARKRKI